MFGWKFHNFRCQIKTHVVVTPVMNAARKSALALRIDLVAALNLRQLIIGINSILRGQRGVAADHLISQSRETDVRCFGPQMAHLCVVTQFAHSCMTQVPPSVNEVYSKVPVCDYWKYLWMSFQVYAGLLIFEVYCIFNALQVKP